jgi:Arc/MetJ family transcription regulator
MPDDLSGRYREVVTPWRVNEAIRLWIIVCMKKTLHIDERLLGNAKSACGAKTDTDTVRLGLEALVRHGAYERLRALRGSEPHARETRRRRERASVLDHATA